MKDKGVGEIFQWVLMLYAKPDDLEPMEWKERAKF